MNGFQIVSEAVGSKDSGLIVSINGKLVRGPLAATVTALRHDIKQNRKNELQLKDLYKRVKRSKSYGDPVRSLISTRLKNVRRRLSATVKELVRIKNNVRRSQEVNGD